MGDKIPQPTATLVKRLRRVAKWLDREAAQKTFPDDAAWRARANTCWQAAGRLEEQNREANQ